VRLRELPPGVEVERVAEVERRGQKESSSTESEDSSESISEESGLWG
jgi:hypothetical protein